MEIRSNWRKYSGIRVPATGEVMKGRELSDGTFQHGYVYPRGMGWVAYIEIPTPGSMTDIELGVFLTKKEARARVAEVLRCKHIDFNEYQDGSAVCKGCALEVSGEEMAAL